MSNAPHSGVNTPARPSLDPSIHEIKVFPHSPVLPAYETGVHLVVWCAPCKEWHYHGNNQYGGDGHRIAHCWKPNSPYERKGYILRNFGPATPEILKDLKRKRPRGLEVQS